MASSQLAEALRFDAVARTAAASSDCCYCCMESAAPHRECLVGCLQWQQQHLFQLRPARKSIVRARNWYQCSSTETARGDSLGSRARAHCSIRCQQQQQQQDDARGRGARGRFPRVLRIIPIPARVLLPNSRCCGATRTRTMAVMFGCNFLAIMHSVLSLADDNGRLWFWDAPETSESSKQNVLSHLHGISAFRWCRNNNILAVGRTTGTVLIYSYDAQSGKTAETVGTTMQSRQSRRRRVVLHAFGLVFAHKIGGGLRPRDSNYG